MKKQKVILVVDDEESFRDIITNALDPKKFIILEANNGKEGIELAQSQHPDLIMLDLIMPEMDGMSAFKEIRKDSWGANVPVIILTNKNATDESLVQDVVNCKPFYYLIKSNWRIGDVVRKIEDILKMNQ